ncbi:MAG: transglutaminase domain-containing protein [Alkalispirochaeta sp.]
MHGRYRSWINRFLRRALLLLLLIPVQRYLSGLMPLWLPPALFLLAVLVERLLHRRRGSAIVSVLVIPAVVVLATTLFWVAAVPLRGSGWWEQQLLLTPWHLLPAALLAETALLWDGWVQRRRAGRTLFVPLMTLAVVAVFWSQARFELSIFPHPTWYAVYAILIAVGLIAYQAISGDRQHGGGRRAIAGSVLIAVLLPASGFAFRGWQARAVEAGGGLLRPTAFQFDFADYVSLEPEISLSRDLVFLYRESHAPRNRLLRRYVLSGYSPRRGFYRRKPTDEPSSVPPLSVQAATDASTLTDTHGNFAGGGERVDQEYYIVNFDPDALIAVNVPDQVARIANWSESSFNSAYTVSSFHPAPDKRTLTEVPWPDELPPSWRRAYRHGSVPEGVATLAREITAEVDGYYETVDAVLSHLLNEYYYSLSPGESPAGNQLEHFLFESRKGYCSYFAFSMTLMLRSLEIPSRVAVGFFIEPSAGMLEFYPVRGDMAHAWVEVWFEGVGWVEFDPTSQQIAPGETIATDYQIDQQRLSELIQEILSSGGDVEQPSTHPQDAVGSTGQNRSGAVPAIFVGAVFLVSAIWWQRRRRRWLALRRTDPRRAALLVIRRAKWKADRRTGGRIGRRTGAEAGGVDSALGSETQERARFARVFLHAELRRLEAGLSPGVTRSLRLIPPAATTVGARRSRVERRRRGAASTFGILAVLFVAAGAGSGSISAQETRRETPDELLQRAEAAVQMENYDQALRRIRRGGDRFPTDHRFPLLQGDVFFDQELFSGARDAYRDALAVGAPDYSTRYALSRALARLNEDQEAVNQLEELHERYPEDLTIIGDLSWQYFKLHHLGEARRLLEHALQDVADDRDLMMTLATVYSGLWDFSAAERTYEAAIEAAERVNDRLFQAVAYYNLSILYANFHRYDEAHIAAERSLETAERSSGYMIRGELRELELSLVAAASDYRRAAALDDVSPLAELSLASLWVQAGYPRRAIARINRITENDSGNWMYNYGTDPARYQRQIYTAYAEAYEALAHQLRLQRPGPPGDRLAAVAEMIAARSRAWYYRGLERKQRRRIADAYAEAGRDLLSRWNRMIAAEDRPGVALRHAAAAEAIEVAFNSAARIEYRLFAAGITNDVETLSATLPELHGRWQRHNRATALRGIYRIRETGNAAFQAAAEAWILSPGEMLTNGLKVPVAMGTIEVTELSRRQVTRILERMGFRVIPGSPLVLDLTGDEGELRYRLREIDSSREVRRGGVRHGGSRNDLRRALEEVALVLTRADEAIIYGEH